jgi:chromatin accessibility complex protein 1
MSSFKPKLGDGSIILPQARVKMIMKSSPDTESISTDALYFVTKATVFFVCFLSSYFSSSSKLFQCFKEFFVEHLAQEIYESTNKSNELTYKGLADIVQKSDSMQFLKGTGC